MNTIYSLRFVGGLSTQWDVYRYRERLGPLYGSSARHFGMAPSTYRQLRAVAFSAVLKGFPAECTKDSTAFVISRGGEAVLLRECPVCGWERWDGAGHGWGGRKTPPKTTWCTGKVYCDAIREAMERRLAKEADRAAVAATRERKITESYADCLVKTGALETEF